MSTINKNNSCSNGKAKTNLKFPLPRPLTEELIKKIEMQLLTLDSETRRRLAVQFNEWPDYRTIGLMLKMAERETEKNIRLLVLQTLVITFKEKQAAPIVARRIDYLSNHIDEIEYMEMQYLLKFVETLQSRIFLKPLAAILSPPFHAKPKEEKHEELSKLIRPVFLFLFEKTLKEKGIEEIVYGEYNY